MSTVREIIEKTSQQLKPFSETAQLDAELLVGHVLNQSRTALVIHAALSVPAHKEKLLQSFVKRRIAQEPVAYIVGHKAFWNFDLKVTPDVLIPRPETELLVEWALTHLPKAQPLSIADLGTGSGALALALAQERPQWHIDATEYSAAALEIAKENAKKYKIKNVYFYEGVWCRALPRKNYHAILGNPPYIRVDDEHLSKLAYEPKIALIAGVDGLAALRHILPEGHRYLLPGGWLVLEHGHDQREAVLALAREEGYSFINDYEDLAGLPRMLVCQK